LGWSGDTVFGHARAGFGTVADGFNQLKAHVASIKPTVILVGYGAVESFGGKPGLPRFVEGLKTLLDVLAETKARIGLIAPNPHEDLSRPLPDPSAHNADLRLYRDELKRIADRRGYLFIDLFEVLGGGKTPDPPLTDNGIHPTNYGYWRLAQAVES